MPVSDNEALVRRAVEVIWNCGDLDIADELFASDYVNHDGVIADLVLGPEAIKISAALHRLAFPDLLVTVEEASTNQDIVIVRWSATRGPAGPLDAGAVANQESVRGITRSRFADGKIVESWTQWDRAAMLRQLGVRSTP